MRIRDWEIHWRSRLGFRVKKGYPLLFDRLCDSITASLVISMVTMPLLLRFFYGWSPYSIFLNLLVLPAMMPVMLSALGGGLAGSLLSFWSEPAGVRLGFLLCLPATVILRGFNYIFEEVRRLPFSYLLTGCPGLPTLIIIYGLELAAVLFWYRRSWLGLTGLGLAACLALVCHPGNALDIRLLSVGQGDCILLSFPDGSHMMVDGGSSSRREIGKYVIGPALKYYGIRRLDYLLITHTDEDHISGIRELLEQDYPVGFLILPDMGGAETGDIPLQEMVRLAVSRGVCVQKIRRGDHLACGRTLLTCLNPYRGLDAEDRNAFSVTLYLEYGSFDALLTGDLEGEQEEVMVRWLKNHGIGKGAEFAPGLGDGLSFLKVAHHGSSHSSRALFLRTFRPRSAAISAGKNNHYGHPHKETLLRLETVGIRPENIFATLWGGAVELETDGENVRIAYWKG